MMETEDVIETLNFAELTRLVAVEHCILVWLLWNLQAVISFLLCSLYSYFLLLLLALL
jgi:hypothetical protein